MELNGLTTHVEKTENLGMRGSYITYTEHKVSTYNAGI